MEEFVLISYKVITKTSKHSKSVYSRISRELIDSLYIRCYYSPTSKDVGGI